MKNQTLCLAKAFRFKRFTRKGYGSFCSLHKVVNIGVVSIGMLFFALPNSIHAQETMKRTVGEDSPVELEEIEVTASRATISLNQAAKIVTVITAQEVAAAPVTSIQDLLEYAVGVDVRQRGEGGTQADISIRGGTFDQIAVLLNGINLSNPQTGHYSFDLPVNLSDIERIEIVSGPSSRIFGASAFAGAINIITKTGNENSLYTDNYGGIYETWKLEEGINHHVKQFSQRLSVGYSSSEGDVENTDYKQLNIFWQSQLKSKNGDFHFQTGYNDKRYGANSFYSAAYPNQFDHTRRFFISAGSDTKGRVRFSPKVYWTRHFDNYKLFRDNPADWYIGHNYHETQVFGVNLNATSDWSLGRTSIGTEFRNEGVKSNVLGKPMKKSEDVPFHKNAKYTKSDNRTNMSYSLEHNVILSRFTFSAGILANYHSSLNDKIRFYPDIDASYRIADDIRIYGSWNKTLRMPTFTDLYYESKVIKGNPDMKPEESEAFEVGIKYNTYFISTYLVGYYRKGKNMIDWIKESPEDEVWESRNLTKVDNFGIETSVSIYPWKLVNENFFIRKAEISYAFIHQDKDSEDLISNYALDYLRHKFTAQLHHSIWKDFSAAWYVRWQDRAGSFTKYDDLKPAYEKDYPAYCIVDMRLNWQHKAINVYVELNNLFNKIYYDLGNIPQPGIWFKAGFNYKLYF